MRARRFTILTNEPVYNIPCNLYIFVYFFVDIFNYIINHFYQY